jgi:hypothetical protein
MDLRKLRNGDWIALLGGAGLIASLFLPWYATDGETLSGWAALTVIDVFLCACALFGVAQWFFTAQQPAPAVPLAIAGLGAWAALLATILTLIRIVDAPADGLGLEYGPLVALVASLGLLTGAWRSLGDERIRLPDGRWSQPAGGDIAADVEVATLPASRAEGAGNGS